MKKPELVTATETVICRAAGITLEELYSRERTRPLADARHAVWLILYEHQGFSYNVIAKLYGRDHTTIAHGVKRIKRTPVHLSILKGIQEIEPKLLRPVTEKRKLREADTWEFKKK